MRAAFFDAPGVIDVREEAVPRPTHGEVLVRVAVCGICGTDQHILHGDFIARYPIIGGHEIAGEVVEVGTGVDTVRVGDRVAIEPGVRCGRCFFCQRGQKNHCLNTNGIGISLHGGFAEYVLAPQANVYPVGDLPYASAAMVEPLSCVAYGVQRLEIPVGANALIFGAGPIGLLMLQLVHHGGASQIVCVDVREDKLTLARRLGAGAAVPGGAGADTLLDDLSPLGFDVVIECTGIPAVVEQGLRHVRNGGRVLLFGVNPASARVPISPYDVYKRDLTILGSFAQRGSFHQAIGLLASSVVVVEPLISHHFPIERFGEALALAASGTALKVQIQP